MPKKAKRWTRSAGYLNYTYSDKRSGFIVFDLDYVDTRALLYFLYTQPEINLLEYRLNGDSNPEKWLNETYYILTAGSER